MKRNPCFSIAVGCALIMLTGCISGSSDALSDDRSGDAVNFDGPWAEEFSSHYQRAENDFVRSVLEDGEITELEYSEVQTRFRDCLAGSGIELSEAQAGGSQELTFPESLSTDEVHRVSSECSAESGEAEIASLYWWMRYNPQNEDQAAAVVACLLKAGSVPANYTVEQYRIDYVEQQVPLLDPERGPSELSRCETDPLGIDR